MIRCSTARPTPAFHFLLCRFRHCKVGCAMTVVVILLYIICFSVSRLAQKIIAGGWYRALPTPGLEYSENSNRMSPVVRLTMSAYLRAESNILSTGCDLFLSGDSRGIGTH